jgi:protein required for attachment to host cells
MIWVIAANAIACRLFFYGRNPTVLKLNKEIFHPENRLKKSDYLTSDKPGHYKSGSDSRGAYAQRTDPKDVELNNFAREIGREIIHARKTGEFEKLILIASPHMEGLILSHLDKQTKEMLINKIQKDPQSFKETDILNYLKSYAEYPDASKH